MIIEYNTGVHTLAGWRQIAVKAKAHKVSDKMCEVDSVITFDGETPHAGMSRTGAHRQKYDALYFEKREIGKRKRLSCLDILED